MLCRWDEASSRQAEQKEKQGNGVMMVGELRLMDVGFKEGGIVCVCVWGGQQAPLFTSSLLH